MAKTSVANLMKAVRRLLQRDPEPQDPYARVRVPLRKGPRDRSGVVALKEPD